MAEVEIGATYVVGRARNRPGFLRRLSVVQTLMAGVDNLRDLPRA